MRRALFICVPILLLGFSLEAQQVTAVAICDWTRVLTTSYRESKAIRDLDDFRAAFQKELASLSNELSDLENQKLEADKAGNKDSSLQLEKTIAAKKTYIDDFRRIRSETYNSRATKVFTGPIVSEIQDAIRFVAERDGFALVIRSDGPGAGLIVHNIPEIDITEKVIKRIYEVAGKTYTGGN
jgi:Skp family chaperone for outer membrane proteins